MEKKKLSLFDLISIGVGSVIGAGIFSMIGVGIQYSGRSIPLVFVLAMLLTFAQNLRPFILSSVFELDGGAYDQNALTLPPVFIGTSALATVFSNFTMSVFAISIADYLAQLLPALTDHKKIIGVIVLTIFYLAAIKGNVFLAKIQNVMIVCMYAALILFVIFGIVNADPAAVASTPFLPQGVSGMLMAVAIMSFTCNGAINIISLAKDTDEARKKIPYALILSSIICAVLYALLGYAATSSLPYDEIAGQNLGFIAQHIMPSALYIFFIVGGAIFALATTLVGTVSAMKWPIYSAAEDGWLPAVFKKTSASGFPWVIMIFMYLLSVIPVIGGFTLESIASLLIIPLAVMAIASNILNWNLPKRFPKAWAENSLHLSLTGYHICLAISTAAALLIGMLTFVTLTPGMMIGNIVAMTAVFAFAILRYKSGKVHLHSRDLYKEE